VKQTKQTSEPTIRVAIVENDPIRVAGYRALLECHDDLELSTISLAEIGVAAAFDVVLLGKRPNQSISQSMQYLRAIRPHLRVIVTGAGGNDETVVDAVSSGAKGYVDETAPADDFAKAIRIVNRGLIWGSRRVLATYIERYGSAQDRSFVRGRNFTSREAQVLKMLVEGCSNKEIASPLGIQERTVKAHVAKLLRKVGVQNRIMLSVHAVNHSLVPSA
jgi:DNA-binding NarL/FixJ family response regulator